MLRPYLTYGALAQPWASCEVTDQQLTVYRVSPTRAAKTGRTVAKSLAVKICSESKSHLSANCAVRWMDPSVSKPQEKSQPWRFSCFPPSRRGQSYVYLGQTWQVQRGKEPRTNWCQFSLLGVYMCMCVCIMYIRSPVEGEKQVFRGLASKADTLLDNDGHLVNVSG